MMHFTGCVNYSVIFVIVDDKNRNFSLGGYAILFVACAFYI